MCFYRLYKGKENLANMWPYDQSLNSFRCSPLEQKRFFTFLLSYELYFCLLESKLLWLWSFKKSDKTELCGTCINSKYRKAERSEQPMQTVKNLLLPFSPARLWIHPVACVNRFVYCWGLVGWLCSSTAALGETLKVLVALVSRDNPHDIHHREWGLK